MAYPELKQKLAEMQLKLMSDDTDPREQENLNVEYEKLTHQLEKMPEYHQEQEAAEQTWRVENQEENMCVIISLEVAANDHQESSADSLGGSKKTVRRRPDKETETRSCTPTPYINQRSHSQKARR